MIDDAVAAFGWYYKGMGQPARFGPVLLAELRGTCGEWREIGDRARVDWSSWRFLDPVGPSTAIGGFAYRQVGHKILVEDRYQFPAQGWNLLLAPFFGNAVGWRPGQALVPAGVISSLLEKVSLGQLQAVPYDISGCFDAP